VTTPRRTDRVCYVWTVPDLPPRSLKRYLPVLGAVVGASAGFAYYWFYGCDSG
jgi:hypothetical protein